MKTITCALLLLYGTFAARAFQQPDHDSMPDIDERSRSVARTNTISAAHEAGVQRLKSNIADLRVGLDERQPRPNFVSRRNSFLTETNGTAYTRL